ncbi:1-phosphatidylinositol phosphodiesterase [Amia ocellicauda]|uniref:1-phosphatidylinositol phosphodiesterase n=1 Tax=Amia ocellicauda TaxID=2972642 RepID=UPI003464C35E
MKGKGSPGYLLIRLGVWAALLAIGCQGAIQTPDYDDTSSPQFLNPSWMAGIPDERPLSEVNLPGTHNSMAFYGGALTECQSWPLSLQLRAGVRFLDVRVRHVRGNLTIHHGIVYQRAHFGTVLEEVTRFLRERPTETVLMRVKEEFSETHALYDAVVSYIRAYGDWDLLWHSRDTPTMGQARGKLIILQNFSGPHLGMSYGAMDIADEWKVPTLLHIPTKWQSVYEHLDAAMAGDCGRLFLTYASGAGVFAYPNAVAQRINSWLYQHLATLAGQKLRVGMVVMDFPGAPLLKMIIDLN